MIIRMSREKTKLNLLEDDKTKASGIREIPFKTIFPSFFRVLLNDIVFLPIFSIQRLFYNTEYGLTMLAIAKKD